MVATSLSLPFNRMADVREITRAARMWDSSPITSSVSPSLKYSFSGSALMFTNGRTTMDGTTSPPRAWLPAAYVNERSSARTVVALAGRRAGSLARHRVTNWASSGGTSGRSVSTGAGVTSRMRRMISASPSPRNGSRR
jgi:hypothetical protein